MELRPGLLWALGLALAVHAAVLSPYRAHLVAAFAHDGLDYATRREVHGFGGFPIRSAAGELDAHLEADAAVRLSRPLFDNEFFRQRVSEGLYPRVVSSRAEQTLRLASRDRFDASRNTPIAPLGPEGVVYLKGRLPDGAAPAPPREGVELDGMALLLTLSATVGLGGTAALLLRRAFALGAALLPPLVVPLAALFVGLFASLATWVQAPFGPRACAVIGWLLLPVGATLAARDRALRRDLVAAFARRTPESWLLAIFLGVVAAGLAVFPIVGWDGRSVWLFQAKRLYFDGVLTLRAATDPDAQWSHTSYPLLLPAWMAFTTSLSPVYNERLIGLGVALLFASELWLVWTLARACLGRGLGAAFTAALALGLAALTAQGFADGHLTLLLVAQLLASLGAYPALPWILALAASLTKLEGLVLSVGTAAVCAVALPPAGGRRAPSRLLPWLVFAPAVIHFAWGKALGLRGDFDDARWGAVLADLPSRAALIAGALPGILSDTPLVVEGAAALALLAAVHLGRRLPTRTEGAALAVGLAFAAFAFGALAVTPRDVGWHVSNALGRLLLHPAAILVLVALLAASSGRGVERGERGAAAPPPSSTPARFA